MRTEKFVALILAAGRGERLRPLTSSTPKALILVSGQPVLGRTLDCLRAAGVSAVVVVTGYRAPKIRAFLREHSTDLPFRILRNPIYRRTNTLYSLWITRNVLSGKAFLLLDGDLVFEQEVLTALLRPRRTNVLACDGARRLDLEAVRAAGAVDGRILQIGKGVATQGKVFGESIGAARIDSNTSRKLFRVAGQLLRNGGSRLYYEAAFQQLIDEHVPFWACNIDGAKWTEIDTRDDLRRAQALFKKSEKPAK